MVAALSRDGPRERHLSLPARSMARGSSPISSHVSSRHCGQATLSVSTIWQATKAKHDETPFAPPKPSASSFKAHSPDLAAIDPSAGSEGLRQLIPTAREPDSWGIRGKARWDAPRWREADEPGALSPETHPQCSTHVEN
jgi:hypothetical protein